MEVRERLIALRQQFTVSRAIKERRRCVRTEPTYWLMNALAFDWHRSPPWYAIASFKYAESLRDNQFIPMGDIC